MSPRSPCRVLVLTVLVLTGVLAVGCSGSDSPSSGGPSVPEIDGLVPLEWSAGSHVQLIGRGFCVDPQLCRTHLTFKGTYRTISGATEFVALEVRDATAEPGALSWTFGPNIPFSQRDELGTFDGRVRAINVGSTGVPSVSKASSVHVVVGPSLLVRQLRPLSGGCAVHVVAATTENTPLLLEVEALGLGSATPDRPIVFSYTFQQRHFKLNTETGSPTDQLERSPGLEQRATLSTVAHELVNGATSTLGGSAGHAMGITAEARLPDMTSGPRNLDGKSLARQLAEIIAGLRVDNRLAPQTLMTAPLADQTKHVTTGAVQLIAANADGIVAARELRLPIYRSMALEVTRRSQAVGVEPPEVVSGCEYGRAPSTVVRFVEQQRDTAQRGYQEDVKGTFHAGLLKAEVEAALSMGVNEEVSSEALQGREREVTLLPGEYAVFWRQQVELRHDVRVTEYDACGAAQERGQIHVTDWTWSYDVAKARQGTCPPFPEPTALRPAGEVL